jgi:hypothetical protein
MTACGSLWAIAGRFPKADISDDPTRPKADPAPGGRIATGPVLASIVRL